MTYESVFTPNSKNITVFLNNGMKNPAKHIWRHCIKYMPAFFIGIIGSFDPSLRNVIAVFLCP